MEPFWIFWLWPTFPRSSITSVKMVRNSRIIFVKISEIVFFYIHIFFLVFQVTHFPSWKYRLSCHLISLTFYRPPSTAIIISELEFDKQILRCLIMCFLIHLEMEAKFSKITETTCILLHSPDSGSIGILEFPLARLLKMLIKIKYRESIQFKYWKAKSKAGLCFAIQP